MKKMILLLLFIFSFTNAFAAIEVQEGEKGWTFLTNTYGVRVAKSRVYELETIRMKDTVWFPFANCHEIGMQVAIKKMSEDPICYISIGDHLYENDDFLEKIVGDSVVQEFYFGDITVLRMYNDKFDVVSFIARVKVNQ